MKRELIEYFDRPKVEILTEDAVTALKGDRKFLHFVTEIQRADVRNRNGRVYPRKILEREVAAYQKKIDERTAFGEGDHPKDGRPSVSRTSVLWQKVWMEEDGRVMGRGKVIRTQVGRDVEAILEAGGQIGTSSRALGTTSTGSWEGQLSEIVNEDLEISAFDVVTDPSVVTAVPERVFQESTERRTMDIKTLPDFKAAHPALYEALVREAVTSAKAQLEPSVARLMEQKTAGIKTDHLAELKKAGLALDEDAKQDYARLRAFADTTVTVLQEAGLIAKSTASDAELVEQVRTLTAANKALTAENTQLTEALDKATTLLERHNVERHVTKLVEASDALREHACRGEIVERALSQIVKSEDAPKRLEEATAYFDGLAKRFGAAGGGDSAAGVGRSRVGTDGVEKSPLEEAAKQRTAAPAAELTAGQRTLRRLSGAMN